MSRHLLSEEFIEKVLHTFPGRFRIILDLVDGIFDLGLRRFPSFLELLASDPGAFNHGIAHASSGAFNAATGLPGTTLYLFGSRV
jgi:hypothetical protein